MLRLEEIFWSRMKESWQQGIRIVATIVSGGGTIIFLSILTTGLFFGYRSFLNWLPPHLPIEILVSFLLAWFLMRRAALRSWLQKADTTFLLPTEGQIGSYLKASALYSWAMASIQLIGLILLLFPLYQIRWEKNLSLWIWGGFLLALLTWNLWISWLETKLSTSNSLKIAKIFRVILNAWLIAVSLWAKDSKWLLSLVIPTIYSLLLYPKAKKALFPWYLLLEQEERKKAAYQRWAKLFVDLPYSPRKTASRKIWIALWDQILPVSKQSTHLFLFSRMLVRGEEILSSYFLLPLWALLLSWAIPIGWSKYIFYLLILLLWTDTIQKMMRTEHLPIQYWLLPKQQEEKVSSIQKILFSLTLLFTGWVIFLFWLTQLMTGMQILISLLLGIAFLGLATRKKRKFLPS